MFFADFRKFIKKRLLIAGLAATSISVLYPVTAYAEARLMVLGVIASAKVEDGIVLVKNQVNGSTFAARVGQEIDANVIVKRVTRQQVYLSVRGQIVKVHVGEETSSYESAESNQAQTVIPPVNPVGMERQGNTVKLTQAFRDQILQKDLSKVLMQAAAVPVFANGEIQGFRISDIEPGSIYDLAGLKNGDTITAINGQSLSDVGRTVKLLHSLRGESRADLEIIRSEKQERLQVVIE